MLTSAKDFESPPFKIPNQQDFAGGFLAFKQLLADEETKILKQILGIALYNEFMDALDGSGDPADKWILLRDGRLDDDSPFTTYLVNDITYEYKGLVDLLVPALYAKWLPLNYRKITSAGVVIPVGQQNTTVQDPKFEIVTAHNAFVAKVGNACKQDNSLYGFMTAANEEDDTTYEDWVFTEPVKQNQLDL